MESAVIQNRREENMQRVRSKRSIVIAVVCALLIGLGIGQAVLDNKAIRQGKWVPREDVPLLGLPEGWPKAEESVRLRGPSDIVRGLTPNQVSVVANLNNLKNREPGEHRIQLRSEDVSRPDNVQVQQIEPASIWLKLEKTVSRRVNIKPALTGQLAEGMEIYNLAVEPSKAEIEGFDLQPCGGTHVRRTAEIGAVRVTQIEKKGKQNRRVRIAFA